MSKSETAVVTGANSGIGHAFAQVLLRETLKGWRVVAIDREIEDSIKSLGCTYMQVDVSSTMSINAFKDEHFAHSEPIDLLLNVAGVMAPKEHDTLQTVSAETLERTFRVNTFGPLLLTQALLPNVLCSKAQPPRIAVMSSRVGSIADNSSGGSYAYRASKTAVNSFFKSMAIELKEKGIPVTILSAFINVSRLCMNLGWLARGRINTPSSSRYLASLSTRFFVGTGKSMPPLADSAAIKASKPEPLDSPALKFDKLTKYEFSSTDESRTLDVHNPATGSLITTIRTGDERTVNDAVARSQAAFEAWRRRPPAERGQILLRCADVLLTHVNELATLLCLENGKPYVDARFGDCIAVQASFRYFGSLIDKLPTEFYDRGTMLVQVVREPHGVCAGGGSSCLLEFMV
ncbi:MAG: hypothetical protein Q9159_000530 [Coniocarpon cinnabarinum]